MSNKNIPFNRISFKEKTNKTFYGILAVIIVLIPEWLAEISFNLNNPINVNTIPSNGPIWDSELKLKLNLLSIYELRVLAEENNLFGYAGDNKRILIKRLIKELRKRA